MDEEVEGQEFQDTCLTRREVVEILNFAKPKTTQVDIEYARTKLESILEGLDVCIKKDLSNDERNLVAREASKMYQNFQERWRKVHHNQRLFERKHGDWSRGPFRLPNALFALSPDPGVPTTSHLNEETVEPDVLEPTQAKDRPSTSKGPGPSFQELASRTQRKRIQDIKQKAASVPVEKLMKMVAGVAKDKLQGSDDSTEKSYLESISQICKTATISPGRPLKIVQSMKNIGKVRNYTAEEALALCIDLNLTVEKYNAFREGNKNLPPYYLVEKQRKACYPDEELSITDRKASVSLVSLLYHTTSRILKLQEEPEKLLSNYVQSKGLQSVHLMFYFSWGFDGSSGHSGYKQGWDDAESVSDHSLLATTIIPLRLVDPSNPNRPLWQNPTPQSVRYCRPLRLQFIKESIENILEERKWVQEQIDALEALDFKLTSSDGEIDVKVIFTLNLTLIDGKVLGAITNTRSLKNCCLCQAKEKEFHDLNRVWQANTEALEYGLSPLHAWIRTLGFLLNLGYKNVDGIRKKVVYKKSAAGKILQHRTENIRGRIKSELKVTVDSPKPGGAGSTNDGNTARMLLSEKNRKKFAEILGLKEWLLNDLHTILTVLSCGLEIDSVKFGSFCDSLRVRYINEYDWYHMPSTIHKILAHGKEVVEAMALPIGMFSEQASESCNKLYKQNRRSSTNRASRKDTMLGMFRRSLESSDPIISNFRLERRQRKLKKSPFPVAAIALLKPVIFEEESDEEDDLDPDLWDRSFEADSDAVGDSEVNSAIDAEVNIGVDKESDAVVDAEVDADVDATVGTERYAAVGVELNVRPESFKECTRFPLEIDSCRVALTDEEISEEEEEN